VVYELKNITKTFEQRTVLNLERLSVKKGKILGLLGPNGAGKTTLLEIMAFLSAANSKTCGEGLYSFNRIPYCFPHRFRIMSISL
jgi:ABC-type multidrug transport system ATPase subunit